MLKQLIAIIILSILAITWMSHAQQGLQLLISAHDWIADMLREVFSGGEAGNLTRELLALLAIPLAVAFVPVIVYWLAKRSWFPYFMQCVWVIWLIQIAALIVLYKLPDVG